MKRSLSASPTLSWSSISSFQDSDDAGPSTNRTSPAYRSHKHARAEENVLPTSADQVIECTVGPICSVSPQTFTTQQALQSHYIKAHSFICRGQVSRRKPHPRNPQVETGSENGNALGEGQGEDTEMEECGKIFPEERLLELHIIENHDPIALVKQSQGENIFDCLLPRDLCSQRFATPKDRRRHMVQKHHYSKQYFFSVVNHGIGDLLRRFGPGVSLIRPTWAPRPPPSSGPSKTSPVKQQSGSSSSEVLHAARNTFESKPRTTPKQRIAIPSTDALRIPRSSHAVASAADSDSENGNSDYGMSADEQKSLQRHAQTPPETKVAQGSHRSSAHTAPHAALASSTKVVEDADMDALSLSLADTSLGFVPRGVRKKQRERGKAQLTSVAFQNDTPVEMR